MPTEPDDVFKRLGADIMASIPVAGLGKIPLEMPVSNFCEQLGIAEAIAPAMSDMMGKFAAVATPDVGSMLGLALSDVASEFSMPLATPDGVESLIVGSSLLDKIAGVSEQWSAPPMPDFSDYEIDLGAIPQVGVVPDLLARIVDLEEQNVERAAREAERVAKAEERIAAAEAETARLTRRRHRQSIITAVTVAAVLLLEPLVLKFVR